MTPTCYNCKKGISTDKSRLIPFIIDGFQIGVLYVCGTCLEKAHSENADRLFEGWAGKARRERYFRKEALKPLVIRKKHTTHKENKERRDLV